MIHTELPILGHREPGALYTVSAIPYTEQGARRIVHASRGTSYARATGTSQNEILYNIFTMQTVESMEYPTTLGTKPTGPLHVQPHYYTKRQAEKKIKEIGKNIAYAKRTERNGVYCYNVWVAKEQEKMYNYTDAVPQKIGKQITGPKYIGSTVLFTRDNAKTLVDASPNTRFAELAATDGTTGEPLYRMYYTEISTKEDFKLPPKKKTAEQPKSIGDNLIGLHYEIVVGVYTEQEARAEVNKNPLKRYAMRTTWAHADGTSVYHIYRTKDIDGHEDDYTINFKSDTMGPCIDKMKYFKGAGYKCFIKRVSFSDDTCMYVLYTYKDSNEPVLKGIHFLKAVVGHFEQHPERLKDDMTIADLFIDYEKYMPF